MITSKKGLEFIMKEEGVVLHPYEDGVGVATIGVGSTRYENGRAVKMTDPPITKERAMSLFHNTLKKYEGAVNKAITREINQNQFDALVSLCYNIGTAGFSRSSVVRKVNVNPCDPSIRGSFEAWRFAGKKPILLKRRQREATLYYS